MAIPEQYGRTLIYQGLAQTDVDMAFHRLINLDTSNLPPFGIPPTIHPPPNQWLHDWDLTTATWIATQPKFSDLAGNLTSAQQLAITSVGTITSGTWQGSIIGSSYIPTLDLIRAPAANVTMAGRRLTDLADPISDGDAVNKGFMDLLLLGLNPKGAVRLASTSNVLIAGLPIIDGVQVVEGDRILLKNQGGDQHQNGVWIAHSAPIWMRATDCDTGEELNRAYVNVLEGTENGGTGWVQVNEVTTIDGDPVAWVLFNASTSIAPGAGLVMDGNTLNVVGTANRITVSTGVDIASTYLGQTSITTLGTITTGSWNGSPITGQFGGTGWDNSGKTIKLLGDFTVTTVIPPAVPAPTGTPLAFQLSGPTNLILPTSGTLATTENTETIIAKRFVKRTAKIASNSKPAISIDSTDVFHITGLSENILSMTDNLTGEATNGQDLYILIRSTGPIGVFSISWGTAWTASSDLSLPIVTNTGVRMFLWFVFNDDVNKWVLVQKLDNIP